MSKSIALNYKSIVIVDMLAVFVIYMIPTLSHLTSVPFYKFEPMRWVLLLNLLFIGDKKNAYIMAVTLPLFSYFVGSHPVFIKALIMALELVANVFVFVQLSKRINSCIAMFLSIVASKLVYYVFKLFCVKTGLLVSDMISTSITVQFFVAIVISLFFLFFSKSLSQKNI